MAFHRVLQVLIICICYSSASVVADGQSYRTRRQAAARRQCLGNDRSTSGVCTSRNQCNMEGGESIGPCGIFTICCSLNTCDVRTNEKVAVFTNPPLNGESTDLECSYYIEMNNNKVCQMRVDFETFNLARPTPDPFENGPQRSGYTCRDDMFKITNMQTNSDVMPALCGDNNGQHLYVRVNAARDTPGVRFYMKTADRSSQPNLPQATWKIKVTQLECSNTPSKGYPDGILGALTSSLLATPLISTANRDEDLIAPSGCLQYYPDREGVIKSFNYNQGKGPYIANMDYATCFKKTPDVCGVKLTAENFNLAYRDGSNQYVDNDCEGPITQGAPQSGDYLTISAAKTADGLRGSKFCGIIAPGQIITSTPPGLPYVQFHSDNLVTKGSESGYQFRYTVMDNCSDRK